MNTFEIQEYLFKRKPTDNEQLEAVVQLVKHLNQNVKELTVQLHIAKEVIRHHQRLICGLNGIPDNSESMRL